MTSMGEIADMMLDGVLCQGCGVYMGSGEGFSVMCNGCSTWPATEAKRVAGLLKAACPTCGRKVTAVGMKDHMRDKHGSSPQHKPEHTR